jgi:arylsulfatase A-like enzyme
MFHAILGDRRGDIVALLGVALCLGIVGGLLVVLWFPGLVVWGVEHLPLPGKARLHGLVHRVSHAAAAYKGRKRLVVWALGLSFVVHFTTAAMYYFTARAISAPGAEFWPIVLASSIQILATVLSPITIAGEGIRELAQLVLLQNMIGAGPAIVSAALGFWAAEALTLAGGWFWWARPRDYTPAWCRVDGQQVDYAAAARAAVAVTDAPAPAPGAAAPARVPPWAVRARAGAAFGLGAGLIAALVLGLGEALAVAAAGFGSEAQVLWYAPLAWAALLAPLCLFGGLVLAALPMDEAETRGWTVSLAWLLTLVPLGLAVTLFRLYRDAYQEQMPPLPVLLAVAAGFGALALLLFFVAPRVLRGRAGAIARPPIALSLVMLAAIVGFAAQRFVGLTPPARSSAPPAPAPLASQPNLILVMVDTLRADHLSCYGGEHAVETPNLCRVATDGGTRFTGFSHASWTKPATATLLTSLVPTSHQAMSKTSALPGEIETLAEALRSHGYTTGGIVSNTNLTEAFGFAQGFDEYQYLGPDYLFGAQESSSKLVLYQILRRVWFKAVPGLRFGDFYQDSGVVNGRAFDFLDRHRGSRFFLFLHYMDPHDPYFRHPYDGHGIARAANQHPTPGMAKEMHELYKGEIAYLDQNFGRLLEKLEALGLYEDTVIVLTADHGEEFLDHGGFWHGLTLYDEQIHVPLLVKWRAGERLAAPESLAAPARLIDVAPTLLARAGASAPASMQGLDLAGDLAARSESQRMVFAEENHEGNVLRAVRTARWKWIEANEGNPRGVPPLELFDVSVDPAEQQNLVEREPGTVAELRRHADGHELAARQGRVGEAKAAAISDEERASLCALGYLSGAECEAGAGLPEGGR